MDLDDQLKLGHLLLFERKCRICGETKIWLMDFIGQEKIEVLLHHHILMNVRSVQEKELRKVAIHGNIPIGRFHVQIPH